MYNNPRATMRVFEKVRRRDQRASVLVASFPLFPLLRHLSSYECSGSSPHDDTRRFLATSPLWTRLEVSVTRVCTTVGMAHTEADVHERAGTWSPFAAAWRRGHVVTALGLPCVLLVTQALFLTSQFAPLWSARGTTELSLTLTPGFAHTSATTYNLPHTLNELRHAKEWLLLLVVFIFSGVWPHVKILATLVAWFRVDPERSRGRWLYWSGVLAVWSYLDIAVVLLIALSFNASMLVNVQSTLSATFEVAVAPCWGAVWFCVAVLLAAATGHASHAAHLSLAREIHNIGDHTSFVAKPTQSWSLSDRHSPATMHAMRLAVLLAAVTAILAACGPLFTATYRVPGFSSDDPIAGWRAVIKDIASRPEMKTTVLSAAALSSELGAVAGHRLSRGQD